LKLFNEVPASGSQANVICSSISHLLFANKTFAKAPLRLTMLSNLHGYRLSVIQQDDAPKVLTRKKLIELHVRRGTNARQRERVLRRWYRQQLKEMIPPLVGKWQEVLGVRIAEWGIKKMKTRWGTCNPDARRIWLNLELAKKPSPCLEYILVHELTHLAERHHNDRFIALMNRHLPNWRQHRQVLNSEPLAHDTWTY
jgi:hypothetical protein